MRVQKSTEEYECDVQSEKPPRPMSVAEGAINLPAAFVGLMNPLRIVKGAFQRWKARPRILLALPGD